MLLNTKIEIDQSKDSQLHIRLSESEKAIVRKASAMKNSSMSQFLRGAVMTAATELISKETSDSPVYSNKDGEYFFSNRPRVNVFSNLFKFRESKIDKGEWCSLYGLSAADFDYALTEISQGKSLYFQYQKWLKKEEESLENF
jgi:hypothetical protein